MRFGKWSLVGLLAGGIFIIDQLTKWAAWHWVAPVRRIEVIPGFFDLHYILNTGVAFGILSGGRSGFKVAALIGVALLALVVIFFFIITTRPRERIFLWGLALVAGGAIGNFVDRIRLWAVIDFLELYYGRFHWPVFNVADIALTVGTGLILIHFIKTRPSKGA